MAHESIIFINYEKVKNDCALCYSEYYCTVHWIVHEMHLRRTYSNSFKKKLLPSKVILPPRATLSTPKRKVSVQYSLETLFWLFIFKLYPFRYCEKNGTESDVKDINMNETSLGGGRQDEKSEWKRLLDEVIIKNPIFATNIIIRYSQPLISSLVKVSVWSRVL